MENTDYESKKLSKLKNEVELLEKEMSFTNVTQRMDSVSTKSEMKKTSLDIKQFRLQIEELKAELCKQKQSDINLIREALMEKCPTLEVNNASSAKDVLELVEFRILDLSKKSQSLAHSLELKKRDFRECKQSLSEIEEDCREDIFPTEVDCIQQIRELEIELAKAQKNISDCENAKIKLKFMLQQLQKRGSSYPKLLEKLVEEKKMNEIQEENINKEKKIEKTVRFEDNLNSKNEEDKLFKEEISEIKDNTVSYGAQDIVSRFLEQKAIHETLLELNKKAEKRLQELKEEKRILATKRRLVKEVDSPYSKSDMELAKTRLEEQEKRLDSAKAELDKVNSVSKRARETIERLILKMKPKTKPKEVEDKTVGELSRQLESHVLRMLTSTRRMNKSKSNSK